MATIRGDHRQPGVKQTARSLLVDPGIIRPTTKHGCDHFLQNLIASCQMDHSRNPTHNHPSPFPPVFYAADSDLCIIFSPGAILFPVMKMKNSKDLLDSVLKTTQMGQIGIRSGLDTNVADDLKQAMESQLKEYDAIESEAQRLAKQNDWQLKEVDPAVRIMSNMSVKTRLMFGNADSKLAAMMIQGNTRGMIVVLKDLHQTRDPDKQVEKLSQKLLETENSNITQMQGFL